jgi:hypothetical protein
MPYGKSVILTMAVTTAGNSHNCRFDKSHRIKKGMKRLTMKVDGDPHHYCLSCGGRFLETGIERLQALLAEVNTLSTQS